MLTFYELSALKYSDNRAEYSDDVTFANFRAITAGTIGDGKLYRSASPINNEHRRASYANNLIAQAGVATVLNLADSEEDIAEYCEAEDFDSEYYRSLYESGNVIALDLNVNFYSDEFNTTLIEGLRFLAQNDPERYETVLNTNLFTMLYHVTGTETIEELAQTDLESAVTNYLLRHGMDESTIQALKDKLH